MKDRDSKFIMENYFGGGVFSMADRPQQVEEQGEIPPAPPAEGEIPPAEGEGEFEEPVTIELSPEEVDVLRAIMMKLPPPEEEEGGELPPEGGEMPEPMPPAV